MEVYRVLKAPYHTDPLSVIGSELGPGRWNQAGQGLLYTASSPALALLETMVHLKTINVTLLPEMRLFVLEVDETLVVSLNTTLLPLGWNGTTAPLLSQTLLTEWIEEPDAAGYDYIGVGVPSAILEMSSNYLFAPRHPLFNSIKQVRDYPIRLDARLWRI